MKSLKDKRICWTKWCALLVALVLFFSYCFSSIISVKVSATTISEQVLYSDLFYGYNSGYLQTDYLEGYYTDVNDISSDIWTDYIDSPQFIWTEIKTGISTALSAKEFLELMLDAYADTSFNYTDAMDAANIEFAKKLLGESSMVNSVGKVGKITKRFDKLLSLYNSFQENFSIYEEQSVVIEKFFAFVSEEEIYVEIDYYQLMMVKEYLLPEIDNLKDKVSGAKDIFDMLKPIAIGLMLEDIRLEMIDDIIANSQDSEVVYEGMCRLRNQLQNGFASYFIQTYAKEEAISQLFSAAQKMATGSLSAYGFVSACLEVASWVTFDLIFDIPDMDDMLVQMILREYSSGMYNILRSKAYGFSTEFEPHAVLEYESIFEGFVAASGAVLDANSALALSSNEGNLQEVKEKYEFFSYEKYIEDIINTISAISVSERKIKNIPTWTINGELILNSPSDTVENNKIYAFDNSLRGDVWVEGHLIIPSGTSHNIEGDVICWDEWDGILTVETGATLTIDGKLEVTYGKVVVEEGATLIINGEVELTAGGCLENNGTIICNDSVLVNKSSGTNGYIVQTEETAKLYLRGDVDLAYKDGSKITGGTVIFDGIQQQSVSNLTVYHAEVLNAEGISGTIHLNGNMDLHGNPCEGTIFMYEGSTLAEGSDYQNVYIPEEMTLGCDIKAGVWVEGHLIIPSGTSHNIEGDVICWDEWDGILTVETGATLTIDGKLEVTYGKVVVEEGATLIINGEVELTAGGCLENNGTIICNDSVLVNKSSGTNGYIVQTEETAKLYLRGDVDLAYKDGSKITGGTVIFDGIQQQSVSNFSATVIILENESGEGVVFENYVNISVLFDHKGNAFSILSNGIFADYDSDGLFDNEDPHPTMHDHIYQPVVTPSTCTAQGFTTHICSCGDSYVADYVDAIGHNHNLYGYDLTNHWSVCACGTAIAGTTSSHTFVDEKCICGATCVQVTTKGDDISYTANGQTVTLTCHMPCRAGYWDEATQKYFAIPAEKNNDASYSFTAPAGVTEVLLVITADLNGDERVTASDIACLNAYIKMKKVMTVEELFAADVNGDGLVNESDILAMIDGTLGKSLIKWEVA